MQRPVEDLAELIVSGRPRIILGMLGILGILVIRSILDILDILGILGILLILVTHSACKIRSKISARWSFCSHAD